MRSIESLHRQKRAGKVSDKWDSYLPETLSAGWVDSIEFRNSMIIIRKATSATHAKVGKRLITGAHAIVNDAILKSGPVESTPARPPKSPLKRLRKLLKN